MLMFINSIYEGLIILIRNMYKFFRVSTMRILSVSQNKKGSFKIFYIENTNLEKGKKALYILYSTLKTDPRFYNFCNNKIIIVIAVIDGVEYSYHHNVLINNSTLFKDYWNEVKDVIKPYFGEDYGSDNIPLFKVMV